MEQSTYEYVRARSKALCASSCHCQATEDDDYGLARWHGIIAYINYTTNNNNNNSNTNSNNNINTNELYLNTVKSETAARVTGLYIQG